MRPQCQAQFSYDAQNNDELSLKEGDIITIISKDECDQGWWKGELNGKIGVFPDNFVVELPSQSEHKNAVSPSSKVSFSTNLSRPFLSICVQVENKPAAADPSAIRPVSVASNRKLLDPKVTPPLPGNLRSFNDSNPVAPEFLIGKKPAIVNQKKSPPASGGGILSKIKDKIVDVVDGATGSKSKTEPLKEKPNIPDESPVTQTFDEVSRRPLLNDVRANRARAPGKFFFYKI